MTQEVFRKAYHWGSYYNIWPKWREKNHNQYIYKTNRVKFVDKTFLEKVSRLFFFISQSENKDINLSFGLHLKGFTHKPCQLPLQD